MGTTLTPSGLNVVFFHNLAFFILVDTQVEQGSVVSNAISLVEGNVHISGDGHRHRGIFSTDTGANEGVGNVVFKIVNNGVCCHRLLATQTAHPVSLVLENIFEQSFESDFVPRFGQIDQVVVNSIPQYATQVFVVFTRPFIEEGSISGIICMQVHTAWNQFPIINATAQLSNPPEYSTLKLSKHLYSSRVRGMESPFFIHCNTCILVSQPWYLG